MGTPTKFLDTVQIATESGGRQVDAAGNPLVGRYRDGTTPKASQRAYGISQIQVGTARATAKKHGIPFDEQKLLTDKDYNLQLGDLHMGDLLSKYGNDRTLARAAYHSGTGTVDKALAKYGREGFAAGLGPEGRNYIQMGSKTGAGGAYNASSPGRGVADPAAYLKGLESALGPEAKASGNVRQNASAIYGSDKELASRAAKVEGQIVQQGQQLDVLDQVMNVAQGAAKEAMTQQVQQTQDISGEIVQGTQELKQKVMPVFQARGRVADQLDKLATMNPLERGLRGIFDLNYDRKYLEGQLNQYDRTLKARSDDYEYLNRLHGVALQEVERRYSLNTAMPMLMQKQAEEDLGLTGMRITQTTGMLGALRDRISTESQLISAKALAREDLLGRLDLPTVTDLMGQAEANGGIIQHGGVEFSSRELRDRIQLDEQQQLSQEGARMSIASGRMEMATKYADNLARSLTRPQLEAAINNGGVHNGIQLPQDVLTNLYQGAISRDETRAATVAREMPAKLAMDTATSHLRQVTGLYQRTRSLFGNQAVEGSSPYTDRAGQLVRRLTQAVQNGEPPEVVAALTQQIAQNSDSYTKFVDEKILTQTGGDKRAAGYLKGFVYGAPLSPGTAAEAMTYFAVKGSLPEGVMLTPEVKQVFQKAQALVKHHTSYLDNGKKLSQQEVMKRVQGDLVAVTTKIVGQSRHDALYNDMPSLAKSASHQFGGFPAGKWREIQASARIAGVEALAIKLKADPNAINQVLNSKKPLGSSEKDRQFFDSVMANAGVYNAIEQQTVSRLVDKEPWIQRGVPNSRLLVDFMGSPQMSNSLQAYGQSLGSQSVGEYLVNPMQAGALQQRMNATRTMMEHANAEVSKGDLAFTRDPMVHQLLQPVARTKMVLLAIPGVGQEGAVRMEPVVQKFFDSWMKQHSFAGVSPNDQFVKQDAAFRGFLQQAKFPEPEMENFRKSALKGWDTHATEQKNVFSKVLETLALKITNEGSSVLESGEYDVNGNRK